MQRKGVWQPDEFVADGQKELGEEKQGVTPWKMRYWDDDGCLVDEGANHEGHLRTRFKLLDANTMEMSVSIVKDPPTGNAMVRRYSRDGEQLTGAAPRLPGGAPGASDATAAATGGGAEATQSTTVSTDSSGSEARSSPSVAKADVLVDAQAAAVAAPPPPTPTATEEEEAARLPAEAPSPSSTLAPHVQKQQRRGVLTRVGFPLVIMIALLAAVWRRRVLRFLTRGR